jgi:hypothetical protein
MNLLVLTLALATSPADAPKPVVAPTTIEVREEALKLTDGGVRLPPRAAVADGGVRLPPRVADGGVRLPPRGRVAVADGGVRLPPRAV